MVLTACFKKRDNLVKEDLIELRELSTEFKEDGLSPLDANLKAVDTLIEGELESYQELSEKIEAKGGKLRPVEEDRKSVV